MVYQAAEEFRDLLVAQFDHTNVGGGTELSADPQIVLKNDIDLSGGHPGDGLIIITKERLVRTAQSGNYRDDVYNLEIVIVYDSADSDLLKSILEEIETVINANNLSISRTAYYQIIYEWNTSESDGKLKTMIEVFEYPRLIT